MKYNDSSKLNSFYTKKQKIKNNKHLNNNSNAMLQYVPIIYYIKTHYFTL